MNVLIVHAHPEPQSFTTSMKDLAAATFKESGNAVQVSDLYAMRFNPVATECDFTSRSNPDYLVYALEQRHNYDSGSLADDISAEIDKLKWADMLVLTFPVFWYSTPAIMKGWIDRVLISGLAYGGKRFYDRGGMRGKRALIAATLGGQPHMFGPATVHGELEVMLRHVLQGTLGYVGFDVLPPFFAYHVPYISEQARANYLDRFQDHLMRLDYMEPMQMPSLDAFDDVFRPLPQ